jgi:hypothetical protein
MSASRAKTPPLGVALGVVIERRADGLGCALRLDRGHLDDLDALLGHAGFIHTL